MLKSTFFVCLVVVIGFACFFVKGKKNYGLVKKKEKRKGQLGDQNKESLRRGEGVGWGWGLTA